MQHRSVAEWIAHTVEAAKASRSNNEAQVIADVAKAWLRERQTSTEATIVHLNTLCRELESVGVTAPFTVIWTEGDDGKRYPSKGYLRPTTQEDQAARSAYDQAKFDREIRPCKTFPSARALVDRAVELMTSDKSSWRDIFAGALVLTGRREYEVAHLARFWPDAERKHWLWFSGQAKKATEAWTYEDRCIPVLVDASLICEGIARLRSLYESETGAPFPSDSKACSNVVGTPVGRAVKRHWTSYFDGRPIKPHDCRRIYGVYTAHWHRVPGQSFEAFLANVLGHSGLGSADSYTDFRPYLYEEDTSLNREELSQ